MAETKWKYIIGEVHPSTEPQSVAKILNRFGGDGWELVDVIHNSSRGYLQYHMRHGGQVSETGMADAAKAFETLGHS